MVTRRRDASDELDGACSFPILPETELESQEKAEDESGFPRLQVVKHTLYIGKL